MNPEPTFNTNKDWMRETDPGSLWQAEDVTSSTSFNVIGKRGSLTSARNMVAQLVTCDWVHKVCCAPGWSHPYDYRACWTESPGHEPNFDSARRYIPEGVLYIHHFFVARIPFQLLSSTHWHSLPKAGRCSDLELALDDIGGCGWLVSKSWYTRLQWIHIPISAIPYTTATSDLLMLVTDFEGPWNVSYLEDGRRNGEEW